MTALSWRYGMRFINSIAALGIVPALSLGSARAYPATVLSLKQEERMKVLELKIPPLVLVALFALVMWLLAQLVPPLVWPAIWAWVVAGIFALTGIAVALAGVLAFRRANTTVDPRVPQQTSSLVIRGIYRYSRNPMYVGFLLLLAAWACYLMNLVALVLLPLFVLYMNKFQIAPEERFLLQKFGAEYQAYSQQVRRWL